MSETAQLAPGRYMDAACAEKMGLKVVSLDWNCDIDPESGTIDPLPYTDPDFKKGYTGITHLRHPVYLRDSHELVTFEDGTIGRVLEDGTKHISWPPQPNTRYKHHLGRLETYDLVAVPHYSENETAAFQLVDFALAKGCGFVLKKEKFEGCYWWDCDFTLAHSFWAREDTRCHAIAQAFLNIDFDDKFSPPLDESALELD